MLRILTARELHGLHNGAELLTWLRGMRAVQVRMLALGITERDLHPSTDIDAKAGPAIAYVNEGRWVADCPTAGCGGAMVLMRGTPFFCGNCLNVEIGHRWRPVRWPADRQLIERALAPRMLPEQANWLPGETVELLVVENAMHGIGTI